MPRDDAHPPVLIAISWQALSRAHDGRAETLLCNCTVVIQEPMVSRPPAGDVE
jgi:hypothetical protein